MSASASTTISWRIRLSSSARLRSLDLLLLRSAENELDIGSLPLGDQPLRDRNRRNPSRRGAVKTICTGPL
jgi:hypothetical protein